MVLKPEPCSTAYQGKEKGEYAMGMAATPPKAGFWPGLVTWVQALFRPRPDDFAQRLLDDLGRR
jgi:hypothetical protein